MTKKVSDCHYCPYCHRVWLCDGSCNAPGDGAFPCDTCGEMTYTTEPDYMRRAVGRER